jgi:hypothetical protein
MKGGESMKLPKGHVINVHLKGEKFGEPGQFIETIRRVLRSEAIGNFNPIFCTYKGRKMLVHSKEGDISDPFRRDDSYLKSLYIEVELCQ